MRGLRFTAQAIACAEAMDGHRRGEAGRGAITQKQSATLQKHFGNGSQRRHLKYAQELLALLYCGGFVYAQTRNPLACQNSIESSAIKARSVVICTAHSLTS